MKVEKIRRYCVNWVEFGTLYFRWYKTEAGAKNFANSLILDGVPANEVSVWTK